MVYITINLSTEILDKLVSFGRRVEKQIIGEQNLHWRDINKRNYRISKNCVTDRYCPRIPYGRILRLSIQDTSCERASWTRQPGLEGSPNLKWKWEGASRNNIRMTWIVRRIMCVAFSVVSCPGQSQRHWTVNLNDCNVTKPAPVLPHCH